MSAEGLRPGQADFRAVLPAVGVTWPEGPPALRGQAMAKLASLAASAGLTFTVISGTDRSQSLATLGFGENG